MRKLFVPVLNELVHWVVDLKDPVCRSATIVYVDPVVLLVADPFHPAPETEYGHSPPHYEYPGTRDPDCGAGTWHYSHECPR